MPANKEYLPEISIHSDDFTRLETLINVQSTPDANPVVEFLERELNRANIIASGDDVTEVVSMHSRVTFIDQETGQERTVMLVYPHEANINEDKVSVLSPIGAALIGMHTGESITWYTPNKQSRILKVLAVQHAA